jgi:hypothetical protein
MSTHNEIAQSHDSSMRYVECDSSPHMFAMFILPMEF